MGAPSRWNDLDKFHFISGNKALVTAVCSPFAGMASDLPTSSKPDGCQLLAQLCHKPCDCSVSPRNGSVIEEEDGKVKLLRRLLGSLRDNFFYGELLRKCEEQRS